MLTASRVVDHNLIQSDNQKFRSRLRVEKNCSALNGHSYLMLVWRK